MSVDQGAIRRFIVNYFNDEEVNALAFDQFQEVYGNFAAGLTKDQKVLMLVDYCRRSGRLDDLLNALKRERPKRYRETFGTLTPPRRGEAEPEPAPTGLAVLGGPGEPGPAASERWASLPPWAWALVALFVVAAVVGLYTLAQRDAGGLPVGEQEVAQDGPAPTRDVPAAAPGASVAAQVAPANAEEGSPATKPAEGDAAAVGAAPSPTSSAQGAPVAETRVRAADEMPVVWVPPGTFAMGSDEGAADEQPVHEVTLDGFWIDQTEVTNAQYRRCVKDGMCEPAHFEHDATYNGAGQPVVGVSWSDAEAYCTWVGARLPTEAEWEYAARGPGANTYPWGDAPPSCDLLQYGDCAGRTVPAGSFPAGASWIGALDMAGNAWEWVNDWYQWDYYATSWSDNPRGPDLGTQRVLRGGAWGYDAAHARSSSRLAAVSTVRNSYDGFRCADD